MYRQIRHLNIFFSLLFLVLLVLYCIKNPFLIPNCFMQIQPDGISEDGIWGLFGRCACDWIQHISSLLVPIYIHMYIFIIYVHLLPLWEGLFSPRRKAGYLRPSAHTVNYLNEWRFCYRSQGSDEDFLVYSGFPFLIHRCWKLLLGKSSKLEEQGENIKAAYYYFQSIIFPLSTKYFLVTFWYPLVFPLHHCIVLSTIQ